MLDLLGARARQEGLKIQARVMDGHALELGDNSFDIAGSQFGVMPFPDIPEGIKEMVRVVQPGGYGRSFTDLFQSQHRTATIAGPAHVAASQAGTVYGVLLSSSSALGAGCHLITRLHSTHP